MEEERLIHAIPTMEDSLIEVERSVRDLRPAHYSMKISSFSMLSKLLTKSKDDKYESGEFEVGSFKWKLHLYPDGDKKKNGSGHISLYLVLTGPPNILSLSSEVNVCLRFFVYDQIRDKYLTVKDAKDKLVRFHAMKTECGFPRLLPLITFKDAANGYLVDDCCTFGAEVFIANCTGMGETISIMKQPQGEGNSFSWKIDNFSTIKEKTVYSEQFTVGGYKWKLSVWPNGDSRVTGKSLSLFLEFEDGPVLCSGQKLYASFKLRVKNRLLADHTELLCGDSGWGRIFSASSTSWGISDFMALPKLKNPSNGFLVNDCLTVEQEFVHLSVCKDFK